MVGNNRGWYNIRTVRSVKVTAAGGSGYRQTLVGCYGEREGRNNSQSLGAKGNIPSGYIVS